MMILPLVVGFISHGFDPIISMFDNTPVQWRRLLRYAIGCLDIIGLYYHATRKSDGDDEAAKQFGRLSGIVVFLGAGVAAGYMAQELYQRYKQT